MRRTNQTNKILNKMVRSTVVVAVLMLTAAIVLFAEKSSSRLQGSVIGENGEPITVSQLPNREQAENIEIKLISGEQRLLDKEKTTLVYKITNNSTKSIKIADIYYATEKGRIEIVNPEITDHLYLSGGDCNSSEKIAPNKSCNLNFTFRPITKVNINPDLVIGVKFEEENTIKEVSLPLELKNY